MNQVKWSTQAGDLKTNYTATVEFIIPELDTKKSVRRKFYVYDSQ